MSDSQEEAYNRVLVIAAHPDDPEFGAGGTIAKWAAQGREIEYVLLTSGDKGGRDPSVRPGQLATRRENEQRSAATALGVRNVTFLRYPDGLVENTLTLRQRLSEIIRRRKPHILLAIDPWKTYQLHPDHRAAGFAALDAVYAAREWNIFPEQLDGDEEPWRVREIYLFWTDNADYWEDVSDTIAARIDSLCCHESQVGTDRLDKRIRERCAAVGERCGHAFAEEFKLIKLGG
jgi:LmbE family N-acetylglucosaminyl deacetylase